MMHGHRAKRLSAFPPPLGSAEVLHRLDRFGIRLMASLRPRVRSALPHVQFNPKTEVKTHDSHRKTADYAD